MFNLFFYMLRMSITGSILFMLLLILQPLTRKFFNPLWHYGMLKCSILFFLLPVFEVIRYIISLMYREVFLINPKTSYGLTNDLQIGEAKLISQGVKKLAENEFDILSILMLLWLVGMMLLLVWQIVCMIKMKKEIALCPMIVDEKLLKTFDDCRKEIGVKRNIPILYCDKVSSPMLVGIVNPKIILPNKNISDKSAKYILQHELAHYQSKDLWVKLLCMIIKVVHWINPLVYIFSYSLTEWMECACDVKIAQWLNQEQRKVYGLAILEFAVQDSLHFPQLRIPFSTTKIKLKRRLAIMLNLKKNRFSVRVLSVLSVVAILMGTSLSVNAATKDFPQAVKVDKTATVETKDSRAKSILADDIDAFIRVSDKFRQDIKDGKVEPINADTLSSGASATTIDENGVQGGLNLDATTYAYCNHSTKDVYVYVHKPSGKSCTQEKWNGVQCTKCSQVWKMDMLSSTYYPNCPH